MNGCKILSECIMGRINPVWINFSLNIVLLHHRFWQLTIRNTKCDTTQRSHTDLLANDVMFVVPLKKVPVISPNWSISIDGGGSGERGTEEMELIDGGQGWFDWTWSLLPVSHRMTNSSVGSSVSQVVPLLLRERKTLCNPVQTATPQGWLQEVEAAISSLPSDCLQIETKVVFTCFFLLKKVSLPLNVESR